MRTPIDSVLTTQTRPDYERFRKADLHLERAIRSEKDERTQNILRFMQDSNAANTAKYLVARGCDPRNLRQIIAADFEEYSDEN